MLNKILIIGVIKKEDTILMRKKFSGSQPYQETWYSFGCDFAPGENPQETFQNYIKEFLHIDISFIKSLSWDTEIKNDYDGTEKQFVYLELEFKYVSGDFIIPENLETVQWIPTKDLKDFDIVPPSVELFKREGYLK